MLTWEFWWDSCHSSWWWKHLVLLEEQIAEMPGIELPKASQIFHWCKSTWIWSLGLTISWQYFCCRLVDFGHQWPDHQWSCQRLLTCPIYTDVGGTAVAIAAAAAVVSFGQLIVHHLPFSDSSMLMDWPIARLCTRNQFTPTEINHWRRFPFHKLGSFHWLWPLLSLRCLSCSFITRDWIGCTANWRCFKSPWELLDHVVMKYNWTVSASWIQSTLV